MKKTRKWRVSRDVKGVFIIDKSGFNCELFGVRYLPDRRENVLQFAFMFDQIFYKSN